MLHFRSRDLHQTFAFYGPNTRWILCDVISAYKTIGLHSATMWAHVFKLIDPKSGCEKWFTDLVSVFGGQEDEQIWQIWMAAVTHILRFSPGHSATRLLSHYVDNFHCPIVPKLDGSPDFDAHRKAHEIIFGTIHTIGMLVHEIQDGHDIESLGWNYFGGPNQFFVTAHFDEVRGEIVLILIRSWRAKAEIIPNHWETINGILIWASEKHPMLICFLSHVRRLMNLSKKTQKAVPVTPEADQALACLENVLETHSSIPPKITPTQFRGAKPDQICRTDGATLSGTGGINITTCEFFMDPLTTNEKLAIQRTELTDKAGVYNNSSLHIEMIAFKKMAIQTAIKPHTVTLIETDSETMDTVWKKGYCGIKAINDIMTEIRDLAIKNNCEIRTRHILREFNESANALAEQNLKGFKTWVQLELGLNFTQLTQLTI
jgi:hypothetical protein